MILYQSPEICNSFPLSITSSVIKPFQHYTILTTEVHNFILFLIVQLKNELQKHRMVHQSDIIIIIIIIYGVANKRRL